MDNNEKYVYGYNLGWNVDNEYISNIRDIMELYNRQSDVLKQIKTEIVVAEKKLEREVIIPSDEQIREYYESDETNKLRSFEAYKERYLKAFEEHKNKYAPDRNEIEKLNDVYYANVMYMRDVKSHTRKQILSNKKELTEKLENIKLQISQMRLGFRVSYDENGNVVNSEKLRELRSKIDTLELEKRKIEHAISELDKMFEDIQFTDEENKLALSGLNPRSQQIYNEMDKDFNLPRNPEIDPENPEIDPENPEIDPENPEIDPENPEKDPENPEKDPENPEIDPEEPEIKVVAKKVWDWTKKHKKQILIALGLTALAISLVVLVTQLIPAILAAQKAAQTAGLMTQMMSNANLWHIAAFGEQAKLHSANIVLANQISSITGLANSFNTISGAWTIGGQGLSVAAQTAGALAAKAAGTVSLLQGITLGTGIGGLGTLGAGLLLTERTDEYKKINEEIKKFKANCKEMTEDEFEKTAMELGQKIENAKEITSFERKMLLSKYKSILKKRVKFNKRKELEEEEPVKGNEPEMDILEQEIPLEELEEEKEMAL